MKENNLYHINLTTDHQDKINYAVQRGLEIKDWKLISLLSGGLTGIPVYTIKVLDKLYVIKLEDINDKNFDLVRNYKIVEAVSKQEISPKIYFSDAERGIILMEYIESKPRPEALPFWMKEFAAAIRNLHHNNTFPKWKSVVEILDHLYQKLPLEYTHASLIKKCMQEINTMENILFDENDMRSCHCDLNPGNILFDGKKYLLVDWQAASPQSFYFDLAYSATWFYFYSEDLCTSFLNDYLGKEANEEEKAKYYLMRIFVHIYLGISFISLPLKINSDSHVLTDQEIEVLPTYLNFMQSIGSGQANLADANTQQQFGFVFLKTAESMMNQKYHQACELVGEKTSNFLGMK